MGRNDYSYSGWAPYVPVAQRRRQAERKMAALKKSGQACQPVVISGRKVASSVWGTAWCDNLEAYSDYANRLPRGRTYVRNGSVVDLRIDTGQVHALVSGSEVYRVEVDVQPLDAAPWQAIIKACTGQVSSLIEVLQGRLSQAVMAVVTRPGQGLFPQPKQMKFRCSCPDSASMCKHVAATLYGVGARLDAEPELLFRLRHVQPLDLIQQLGAAPVVAATAAPGALAGTDLSALFGIDLGDAPAATVAPVPPPGVKAGAKKPAVKAQPKARPTVRKSVSAADLLARGLPRHMIQRWLTLGVLVATAQRGVYQTTALTDARIKDYLAR